LVDITPFMILLVRFIFKKNQRRTGVSKLAPIVVVMLLVAKR